MFLECQVRLVDDFDSPEPLDVVNALEARNDQTQRKAVVRTDRLAVLTVRDEHIVQRFGQRDAFLVLSAVRSFRDDPFRSVLQPDFFE